MVVISIATASRISGNVIIGAFEMVALIKVVSSQNVVRKSKYEAQKRPSQKRDGERREERQEGGSNKVTILYM
jgi:hypothetical protein